MSLGQTNIQNDSTAVGDSATMSASDFGLVSKGKVWFDYVELDIDVDTMPKRLFEPIPVVKEEVKVEEQEYSSKRFDLVLPKVKPNLKVYPIKDDAPKMPYGNLVSVGFGNYTTPFLEVFATSKKLTPLRFGTHVKHFSSSTGPVDKKNSAQSLNYVDVFADYFSGPWTLSANVDYTRLGHNYYGYLDTLTDVERDTIGINYHVIHGGAGLSYLDTSKVYKGALHLDYFRTSNNWQMSESDFVFGLTPRYEIGEHQRVILDIHGSLVGYTDTTKLSRTWLSFKPYYTSKADRLNYSVGFNLVLNNDSIYDKSVYFYPEISANILLERPHGVRAYVGITGESQRNTMRSIIGDMPWLAQQTPIFNTNHAFIFYGGMKGTLIDKLTIDLNAKYDVMKFMPMFINDSIHQEEFNIVYEDANVFALEGEIMYHGLEDLNLSLNTVYRSYGLDNFDKAIHLPGLDMSLYASYKIKDKVRLIADFYYLSLLYSYDYESQSTQKMNDIVDLNLHGVYYFNEKMNAFLEFNNLLTKKYERYLHYKNKGISFLAGISYKF